MATDRPPPYFPQGTLSPPDEGRYRRFKLALVGVALLVLLLLSGIAWGSWYLLSRVF